MSKHLGNILEPIPLMDEHGADAVRWFMAAGGSPWAARRVGHTTIQETVRKVLLTYWNTVAFHVLYANLADWTPGERRHRDRRASGRSWTGGRSPRRTGWSARSPRRWSSSTPSAPARCSRRTSTTCPTGTYAARAAASGTATPPRFATLHECLLRRHPADGADGAVHHRAGVARRVRGHLRRAARVGAPRPTGRVQDASPGRRRPRRRRCGWPAGWSSSAARPAPTPRCRPGSRCAARWSRPAAYDRLSEELRREIAEELNIGALEPLSAAGADLVDHTAKGNFRALGKRFAKDTPRVAAAIAAADAGALAAALKADGRASVDARRRARRGAARRGDRLRAAARGLVGGQRAGRDGRARPRADPRAAPRRPGPRGGPDDPGGPQDRRASRSPTGSR